MYPNTIRLGEIIHEERMAEVAQWAPVTVSLRDRLRVALSKRLIAWGERLAASTMPMKARV